MNTDESRRPCSTRCHVCGFDAGEPPWGESECDPTFNICECCGVEFGYEDHLMSGVLRCRKRWIESGGIWFRPKAKPSNWDMAEQIKKIPSDVPIGIDRTG